MIAQVTWVIAAFVLKEVESNGVIFVTSSTTDEFQDKLEDQGKRLEAERNDNPRIFDSFAVSIKLCS